MHKTASIIVYAIIITIGSLAWTEAAPPKQQPTSSQVPAVVKALKDKYGMPVDLSKVMPIAGLSPVATLNQLLELERIAFPDAWVSSTFYDYRDVSVYRRTPGLHLGYDIAMPAGAEVRVGWPGTVVSIAPWYTNQWGVTVASSNGTEVTYGHIVPTVQVGAMVNTGDIVGQVSLDHVDVKMRDANGNYVPFGEDGQSAPEGALFVRALPTNSRESLIVGWLVAQNEVDTTDMELQLRQRELKTAKANRDRLEERYSTLHKQEVKMAKYLEDGLVARVEVEKVRRDLAQVRVNLLMAKQLQRELPLRLNNIKTQLGQARERLQQAKQEAEKAGITWSEVTALVNNSVARDANLTKSVKEYKKGQVDENAGRRVILKKRLQDQKAKLAEYQRLYDEGGLPRMELENLQRQIENTQDMLREIDGA